MKMSRAAATVLVVVLAIAVGAAQAQKPETIAASVMKEIAARQFEKAASRFGDPLKSRWTVDRLPHAWDDLIDKNGAFRDVQVGAVSSASAEYPARSRAVAMTVVFERVTLDDSRIIVGPDGHVVGVELKAKAKQNEPEAAPAR